MIEVKENRRNISFAPSARENANLTGH